MSIHITGFGTALGERMVTNIELETFLDTSDTWIKERTGIHRRHWGGTTEALATQAGKEALFNSNLDPEQIDLIILATTTPDRVMPATSCAVQYNLGLSCGAFDLNGACSGFVYAIVVAHSMLVGGIKKILIIGADTLSRVTDMQDRTTAVLFGDGAGAVVLENIPFGDNDTSTDSKPETFDATNDKMLLGWDAGVDGSALDLLYCNHGGYMQMEGQEVFRKAVRATVSSILTTLKRAKLTSADIALFIPHQANSRIIEAVSSRLGIPEERTVSNIDYTGNTSSASIPLAMAKAASSGRINKGDNILLAGFGAGMTWASAVIKWNVGK
ncbi:MAG: ketoacyl-ACP synthase III [Actinobacteria bacterium]|nr:ketoacyl-ACP synthase III [Actinomycetota bacterium]MCL6104399.1 ketoacyl-ACP synthase III [Actinomycetota bacterium]